MLFTLIGDRDAWLKFFEYFDLVQKIEDATHTNIERLANALSIKFYDISNHGLSCELYEEGDAGGGVQFTIDDIICEARFYATGSEELDDSFVEYFIPINNTECLDRVGMSVWLKFIDSETGKVLFDLGEIKSKNK